MQRGQPKYLLTLDGRQVLIAECEMLTVHEVMIFHVIGWRMAYHSNCCCAHNHNQCC